MAAVYPTSVKTYTTKTNKVDVVDASHVNDLQTEVVALQTYIGTNPHGSRSSLTDRLAYLVATDGGIYASNAFPAGFAAQAIWRSDLNAFYIRNTSNTSWLAQGVSLSNVLFQYSAVVYNTAYSGSTTVGEVAASTLTSNAVPKFRFISQLASATGIYSTVWETKWKKDSGISTIQFRVQLWQSDTTNGGYAKLNLSVGSVAGTVVGAANSTNPVWISGSLDVSGLDNGTFYNVTAMLQSTGHSSVYNVYMGNLISFGA